MDGIRDVLGRQRVGALVDGGGLGVVAEADVAELGAADQAGLDPTFAEKFLTFVIAEVIHHHEAIAGS